MGKYTINPTIPGAIFKKKVNDNHHYWHQVANIDSIQGLTFCKSTDAVEQKQILNFIRSFNLFEKIMNEKKTIFFPCNE